MYLGIGVVELAEVRPDHAPRAGTFKGAVRFAHEIIRVLTLQLGGPAGVVHRDVEKNPAVAGMDRVDQLAELFQRRRLRVEVGQRRIDVEVVQRRERAAVTPHPAVLGRRRVDRQQLQNPAAELVEDMVQLLFQRPECAGGRNHGIAPAVEFGEFFRIGSGDRLVHIRAELPHEGRIDRIARRRIRAAHLEAEVLPLRPQDRRTVGGQEAAFRLEYADFSEGQREFRHAGSDRFHRQVVPVEAGERAMLVGARDDFGAADRGAADIGADDGGSGPVRRDAVKTEGYGIAGVENSTRRTD